ncbi:MAG TPA: amidohydrolase family protein [Casimicrobiaceae bacterium]|nr:amidohydrolase family protein [Casimicrobiaceae bacterium]
MKGTLDIVGGRLIDAIGDRPKANASLRVKDGRIVAIWEGSRAPSEAADRVIDAHGKTVMPGLIDAHCHISYGEGRSAEEVDVYGGAEWAAVRAVWNCAKVLRAGVTSFCDPGSTWLVAVTARDAIASGMFPGPRMFAAGRHIVADGGFADYFPTWLGMPVSAEGVLCHSRDEMLREVRQQVKNRVDLVKMSGDSHAQERMLDAGPCLSDDEMQAIVSTAHSLGRKTTIHARYPKTVLAAVRAGVDWVIHASYLRDEDVGIVRDARTPICATLTFTANIVEWGRDVGVDPNYIDVKKRELDALVHIQRRAYEADIPMLAGSEAGFSVTPYGEFHAREIELLVKLVGMSPMDAIKAATANNAAAFGWKGDVGTLERGARADVLIVDGDPLADIAILGDPERIATILHDGDEVDRRAPIPERKRMAHERGFGVSQRSLSRADTQTRRGQS